MTKRQRTERDRSRRSPEGLAAIRHPGAGRMRHRADRRPKDARRAKEALS